MAPEIDATPPPGPGLGSTGFSLAGPGFRWSPEEVEQRIASRIKEIEGEPRSRVRTAAQTADFVVDCVAIWRSRGVLVPLPPDLPDADRRDIVARIAEASLPDDAAAVIWTSGTSGRPRGVILGHGGLAHVARQSAALFELGPTDVWGLSLSPAHVGGLATIARATTVGHGLWVGGPFRAAEVDTAVDEGRVTHLSLVPTMLDRWLRSRGARPIPGSLRGVLLGGAASAPALVRRARALGMPVFLTYGMTEASSQVATGTPQLADTDPGAVGEVLDGVFVSIGRDGQVRVKGPTLALGFLDGEPLPLDDGWFATGDLGRLDDNGILRIVGRSTDRIISGGVNVDPLEVEHRLREHEAVQDVCIVGLPDDEWGQRVVALVVWAGQPADLTAWCRVHLGPAQRPRAWVASDAIPTNVNGKIDRLLARELAAGRPVPRRMG